MNIHTISPIDVDVWDLTETQVKREWQNIDITLVNETRRFVGAIENKVYSEEHSDQLQRYKLTVETTYPGWDHHFVFLSASDRQPSDSETYVAITYEDICQVVDSLIRGSGGAMGTDLQVALSHYVTMVRRRVMPDQEIQDLCQRIYTKHRQALNLIFEHRPDLQSDLHDALVQTIEHEPGLILDVHSKQYVNFLPAAWDTEKLRQGEGWTPSHRMLMFQFLNRPDSLTLLLYLSPGDLQVRKEVFARVMQARAPFNPRRRTLPGKWATLYTKRFLQPIDYSDADLGGLTSKIEKVWEEFKEGHFVSIQESLQPVLS